MNTRSGLKLLWLGILMLVTCGCGLRRPIRVGFSGQLTGHNANLGVDGRNGAQLAVEDLNTAGGIAGRQIELLVRDDLGTPEGAQAADSSLIEAGVVAIIGHMTSSQSVAAVPLVNQTGVVLLSPTTSTSELTGLDDYFLRVTSDSSVAGTIMANYVLEERGLTRLAMIYDTDNAAFSNTYCGAFRDTFTDQGGHVTAEIPFSSSAQPELGSLVAQLRANKPEALLIVASSFDTALIAQQVHLVGWQVPLFTSGWAQTETLIQNGGQAVEGMEIARIYDPDSPAPAFLDFQTRYRERFGETPSFAAAQSYEAVTTLAAALESTRGRAEDLKGALLEIGQFEGLTGGISMDRYGDAVRTHTLIAIRDGQFVKLKTLEH